MVKTFREYLQQQVKLPRVSISHLSWHSKAVGADVGLGCLIVSGIAWAFFPPLGIIANKLFMLLWIGCPFIWIYSDYCYQRIGEEKKL